MQGYGVLLSLAEAGDGRPKVAANWPSSATAAISRRRSFARRSRADRAMTFAAKEKERIVRWERRILPGDYSTSLTARGEGSAARRNKPRRQSRRSLASRARGAA